MCEDPKPAEDPDSLTTDELPAQTGKEVQVRYRDSPVRQSPDKRIHERAQIPRVPEGEKVPDETPSPPVDVD